MNYIFIFNQRSAVSSFTDLCVWWGKGRDNSLEDKVKSCVNSIIYGLQALPYKTKLLTVTL